MPHNLTITIRQSLAEHANPEKALPMQKYAKSEMPYRGVQAVEQRKIYTSALKQYPIKSQSEYELVIRELWDNAEYREERYGAYHIAEKYSKFQTPEMLPLYRKMIITGAWWDYVDAISAHIIGALLLKYPQIIKPVLYNWIADENLWIRRTAILAQLTSKDKTDWEMLKGFCLKCLKEESFWIRKAIGWALRQYSKTNPQAVREFVNEHQSDMSGVTLREAKKYI
jgi:3-methyladenine DNA glycosylase AlkD